MLIKICSEKNFVADFQIWWPCPLPLSVAHVFACYICHKLRVTRHLLCELPVRFGCLPSERVRVYDIAPQCHECKYPEKTRRKRIRDMEL